MQTTKTKHPKPKRTDPATTSALKASFTLSLLEDMHFTCCYLPAPYNGQHAFLHRSSKQKIHVIIKKVDPILGKINSYTSSDCSIDFFFSDSHLLTLTMILPAGMHSESLLGFQVREKRKTVIHCLTHAYSFCLHKTETALK